MTMTMNSSHVPDGDPPRSGFAPEGAAGQAIIPTEASLPGSVGLRSVRVNLDALPADMIITIDGPARTGKNTAGELVAEAIGGVLVDSGRFYRALTQAAVVAGINLDVPEAIVEFCQHARLEACLGRDGGLVEEALVTVNGTCFSKGELNQIGAATPKLANVPQVRGLVNGVLHGFRRAGRVVMLGRDIGARVFPDTPFKFFLNAPQEVLEQRQIQTTGVPGVDQRLHADRRNTLLTAEALEIDTSKHLPTAVCGMIVNDLWNRVQQRETPRAQEQK